MIVEARPSFASVLADEASDAVIQWLTNRRMSLAEDAVKSLLIEAWLASGEDCYTMVRAIENVFEWPVDTELVLILNSARLRTDKFQYRVKVKEWVVKTGMRVTHAPGAKVRFRQGDRMMSGSVHVPLKDTAEAIIALDREHREMFDGMMMLKVSAEMILPNVPALSAPA